MSDRLRIPGEAYEPFVDDLGNIDVKISILADEIAAVRFGERALSYPSDIELTPAVNADKESIFMVKAWHETASSGAAGVFQEHIFSFEVVQSGEMVLLAAEENVSITLTPREAVLMTSLGRVAYIQSFSALRPDLEDFRD